MWYRSHRDGTLRDLEAALGPEVVSFVEQYVGSLLSWDIIVFFSQHQDEVVDVEALATRLGRAAPEIEPEVDALCAGEILQAAGGLIRYRSDTPHLEAINGFTEACRNRNHRLALIARVLQKISPHLAD